MCTQRSSSKNLSPAFPALSLDLHKHTHALTQVRNHVLARWRADVTRYLPLDEACKKIQVKFHPLVKLAWELLSK